MQWLVILFSFLHLQTYLTYFPRVLLCRVTYGERLWFFAAHYLGFIHECPCLLVVNVSLQIHFLRFAFMSLFCSYPVVMMLLYPLFMLFPIYYLLSSIQCPCTTISIHCPYFMYSHFHVSPDLLIRCLIIPPPS